RQRTARSRRRLRDPLLKSLRSLAACLQRPRNPSALHLPVQSPHRRREPIAGPFDETGAPASSRQHAARWVVSSELRGPRLAYPVSMRSLPSLAVIVGPTASGKSALGIFLAKEFGGEVVACDSTQLYRGFDVG